MKVSTNMLILASVFGVCLTLCYITAVVVLRTDGALFTVMTNALVAILMLALGYIDKEKLKKLAYVILRYKPRVTTGCNNRVYEHDEECSNTEEPEGPGE